MKLVRLLTLAVVATLLVMLSGLLAPAMARPQKCEVPTHHEEGTPEELPESVGPTSPAGGVVVIVIEEADLLAVFEGVPEGQHGA